MFIPILPILQKTLDAGPVGEVTFICGAHGRPFAKAAFGYNLFGLARALSGVPGDIAVCGIYEGHGAHLLLEANADNSKWLFGFEPIEETAGVALAKHRARVHLHKGEMAYAFDKVTHKRFSFVHIDVEDYAEIKDALDFFWPRVTPGGVIFLDDYRTKHTRGGSRAVDEFAAENDLRPFVITTGQAAIFKLLDYAKRDVPIMNSREG